VSAPDPARVVEAVLFAAAEPLSDADLQTYLPEGADLPAVLGELTARYDGRGVNLMRVAGGWAFRTAPDLAGHFRIEKTESRRLSRAAMETLAVIAYHQPVTRAEIEAIRGVAVSKGTLDVLLEAGWVRPGRRRQTPGRPLTWTTTPGFLDHFGLASLEELPGLADLKAAGLLDVRPASAVLPGGRAEEEDGDDAEEGADDDGEGKGSWSAGEQEDEAIDGRDGKPAED
jgi:segregation and condensation protein B